MYSLLSRSKNKVKSILGLKQELILIYTLSKVGSSSVYFSLKKTKPHWLVKHVHFLGETWLNKFRGGNPIFQNNLDNATYILELLKDKSLNVKVVTLTRDPIARDISGIFQRWEHIFKKDDITEVTSEDILEHLGTSNFEYSENWFETDFLEFTGLKLKEMQFDSEKGYTIYNTGIMPVLVMQLEQLNDIYHDAMNDFLGKDNFTLQQANITASRQSGALNKVIKDKLKLPESKLNQIYSTEYVKTFYSPSQIKDFKERWQKM